ncbi:MAG: hypothetical protein FJ354_01815 [Thaumarchaeota archaeon]|nr:hypothetical protein [Nitrososphaerota archaeon]
MDKRLEQKINQKITDALSNTSEINNIAKSIDAEKTDTDFKYGIIIGRLYNSFYYQSRRILERDPTPQEFAEFLKILSSRKNEILQKL